MLIEISGIISGKYNNSIFVETEFLSIIIKDSYKSKILVDGVWIGISAEDLDRIVALKKALNRDTQIEQIFDNK